MSTFPGAAAANIGGGFGANISTSDRVDASAAMGTLADNATIATAIKDGQTTLGIELGSTNIKACLIDADTQQVIATGSHTWENSYVDRMWTYPLDAVWAGIQDAVAKLLAATKAKYGVAPTNFAAIGISAMMHGYLAFDAAGELLVPFRTWRNTNTGAAAAALTTALDFNMPLRWSAAHYYQALLDNEPHIGQVAFLTTLAGYVHWRLTGAKVMGVGDASGMFPIDPLTGTYDAGRLAAFDKLAVQHGSPSPLLDLLPAVLPAGAAAGHLTAAGALLLDPSGTIQPGALLCPPEGDAGTGMVATNAVAPRTGNVSVGTSIFAMVVLEQALQRVHSEVDIVTTPAGDLVAMIHCNNGASELATWVKLFSELLPLFGVNAYSDAIYEKLLGTALTGAADGGGLIAYNYLAGEPITGLTEGRPLVARTPDSDFSLANFTRAEVYTVFATLALGMRILTAEGVAVEQLVAHGGLFKTPVVAQRLLAAAVNSAVAVAETAGEGGAWGIAVLAAYAAARQHGETRDLTAWLADVVFASQPIRIEQPLPDDVAGFNAYLDRFSAALPIQHAATATLH